jgi:hypothetical protein
MHESIVLDRSIQPASVLRGMGGVWKHLAADSPD